MKSIARRLIGVIIVGMVFVTLNAPAAQAQAKDNFTITSYDVKLVLGRDDQRRSTLKTTETITADFAPNKNRGIERNFVRSYDGHSTSLQVESVTDEKGNDLPHNWDDNRLRIGEEDVFVQGSKTYVITYAQRDVTRYYRDTNKDEFYWDVIGLDWRVPIAQASVSLKVDDSIVGAIKSDLQCYRGKSGESNACKHEQPASSSTQGLYEVSATELRNREGVTISLGFAPETFEPYKMPWWQAALEKWLVLQAVVSVLGTIVLIALGFRISKLRKRQAEMGTIVPEYLPPPVASVTASATLYSKYGGFFTSSATSAQLLDLAVRHYIKLYEVKQKTVWTAAQYEIEVTSELASLRAEERELITDMFGKTPKVGERLNLKALNNNTAYYTRTTDNDKKLEALMTGEYKLYAKNEHFKKRVQSWARKMLITGIVLLSPIVLIEAGILYAMARSKVLTDEGLSLRRYLEGLKLYIKVAEKERIAMLQSPEGVEKVKQVGGTRDDAQLLKLYERVLPYAVLFGQEKEWTKQLGQYYEQTGNQPDWYTGTSAFSAAAFASGMTGLSSASSTVSSSSSSSGGSSGGGSSGGGGGGGGGGGW